LFSDEEAIEKTPKKVASVKAKGYVLEKCHAIDINLWAILFRSTLKRSKPDSSTEEEYV
jgi:hypothetical protein